MELWDLYDKNRNLTGKKHIRGEALEKGLYHLVVEIWTIDKMGNILLTQRHPSKNHYGNAQEELLQLVKIV